MLLDFADETKKDLLQVTDNVGNKADAYANESSFLGTVLSLSTIFDGPSLHMAAWRNDRLLLSWMLEMSSDDIMTQINRKNDDGQTVLHVASIANSPDVIKQLSEELGVNDFWSSAMEFTQDGQGAIHLAVISNYPSSVHALLEVLDDEHRKKLLHSSNQMGQNAMELTNTNAGDAGDECLKILRCK